MIRVLGGGELPDQPAVPVAGRFALAEVDEFLDLPAEPAVALAAGPGLAHVQDVGAVDPLGGERFRLQGGVLFLEDAGRALGQELRPEALGLQHREDPGFLRDPVDLKVPQRPEPGDKSLRLKRRTKRFINQA